MKRLQRAALVVAAIASLGLATVRPYSTEALTYNVGGHIHTGITNHPVDGHPIPRAPYTFHVVVKEHNMVSPTTLIRVDDASTSAITRAQRALVLGPCADCTVAFDWTIDFSTWAVGRHELRWHTDVRDADLATAGDQHQFTTARQQVCVESCLPNLSARPANYSGGGSWYLSRYAVVTARSPDSSFRPGGTITASIDQEGIAGCGFLNPKMHDGSAGTWESCWTGSGAHSLTIPAFAVPGDRFVLYATDGHDQAGLTAYTLGNGSPRATYPIEFQSWWAKAGLVLPPVNGVPSPTPTPTVPPTPTPTPSPTAPPTASPSPAPTPTVVPTPPPSVCGVP